VVCSKLERDPRPKLAGTDQRDADRPALLTAREMTAEKMIVFKL
jgi:hypothetical protein